MSIDKHLHLAVGRHLTAHSDNLNFNLIWEWMFRSHKSDVIMLAQAAYNHFVRKLLSRIGILELNTARIELTMSQANTN